MKNFIYYIGADSDLQKQITWDSVEDVIKCVKSAIKYGVVPGCQISIARACINAMNDIVNVDNTDSNAVNELVKNMSNEMKLKFGILNMILNAIKVVYAQVIHGPDGIGIVKTLDRWQYTNNTDEAKNALINEAIAKGNSIIDESIAINKTFDLESLDFKDSIITSAETDSMVLSVASDLIKILISGNQCIFLDSDVNESHNETQEVYV